MSHNKTLAAQLYSEFKEFFPHNAVHYFVSYYDYYQPEAYIPQRDIYIEKDASINQQIDRLRLAATSALVSRRDVIIVASVSCIYGLGSPEDYRAMMVGLELGQTVDRDEVLAKLVDIQYERNDIEFQPGKFRVRGDCVEIWPTYEEFAFRVEFWGDEVEQISVIHPTSGEVIERPRAAVHLPSQTLRPARRAHRTRPSTEIKRELEERLEELFKGHGKLLEAQRLSARTRFDMEMMQEVGYCPGIENYSRPLCGRPPGSPPDTLFSFFPEDYLLFVDESHVTVPQVRGMYFGDHNRKVTLVEHGFRLPSALDNRPLRFEEWEGRDRAGGLRLGHARARTSWRRPAARYVEQVIRPTGLLDPEIEVAPARVAGAAPAGADPPAARPPASGCWSPRSPSGWPRTWPPISASRTSAASGCIASWTPSSGSSCSRDLRQGEFDVLVGVNLLREGLDLPEVSLVAILDADKEGFLRSETSLMQTIGRSARNVNAKVMLYADKVTDSMQRAIEETRPPPQDAGGVQPPARHHAGNDPQGIRAGIEADAAAHAQSYAAVGRGRGDAIHHRRISRRVGGGNAGGRRGLEFERAAALRDRIAADARAARQAAGRGRIEHATRDRRGRGRRRGPGPAGIPKPKRST